MRVGGRVVLNQDWHKLFNWKQFERRCGTTGEAPNYLVKNLLEIGFWPQRFDGGQQTSEDPVFSGMYSEIHAEARYKKSRFDFWLQGKGGECFLEVKSVTLVEDGVYITGDDGFRAFVSQNHQYTFGISDETVSQTDHADMAADGVGHKHIAVVFHCPGYRERSVFVHFPACFQRFVVMCAENKEGVSIFTSFSC